ncbi:MAG: Gfo/Idh/MocA family oxidoreductase [Bacteroidota bacterium]|nr:Gfo/Idh/MocA family oxidoreductase [Bacteroidota bacterium]
MIGFHIWGFGHIGKRYAEIISKIPEVKLMSIIDIDSDCLSKAKSLYPAVSLYQTTKEWQQDNEFVNHQQIGCICVPNGLHLDLATVVKRSGLHLLIEKPLDILYSKCLDFMNHLQDNDKMVFCVLQNRYTPVSQLLKHVVSNNLLGKINFIQVNCFWNRDEKYYQQSNWRGSIELDGGPLFTQFSHYIDSLVYLFGELEFQSGFLRNFNHQYTEVNDDTGIVVFKAKSNILGTINYTTSVWDKNLESSITIIGDKGSVKAGGQYMENIDYLHFSGQELADVELRGDKPEVNNYGHYKGSAGNHKYILEQMIRAVNSETFELPNIVEAAESIRFIESIYQNSQIDS